VASPRRCLRVGHASVRRAPVDRRSSPAPRAGEIPRADFNVSCQLHYRPGYIHGDSSGTVPRPSLAEQHPQTLRRTLHYRAIHCHYRPLRQTSPAGVTVKSPRERNSARYARGRCSRFQCDRGGNLPRPIPSTARRRAASPAVMQLNVTLPTNKARGTFHCVLVRRRNRSPERGLQSSVK